jgi:glutaredoxin 3
VHGPDARTQGAFIPKRRLEVGAPPSHVADLSPVLEPCMSRVEIYTTAICPYCVAAKNFLKQRGLTWEELRVDIEPARREEMLARSGGRRSVPQIFVNGAHVGGFDDLVASERSGRLRELTGADA